MKSRQEATVDTPVSVPAASSTVGINETSRYAAIRSPKLREALRQREALSSEENLRNNKTAPPRASREREEKQTSSFSPLAFPGRDDLEFAGEASAGKQEASVVVQLRKLSLCDGPVDDAAAKSSDSSHSVREFHNISDSLQHPERPHVRVERKRVGLYSIGRNPRLGSDAEAYAGSSSNGDAGEALNYALEVVSSGSNEVTPRRVEPASRGPPLAGEGGSMPADEDPIKDENGPGYEADISDNQSSASERTAGRRTRRKSPHSRLTTPLSMYDFEPRFYTRG